MCAVVGRDNFFRDGIGEVGTPIGDDPIATVGGVAASAVADDRVVGDLAGEGKFLDGADERGIGLEEADAVCWLCEKVAEVGANGPDELLAVMGFDETGQQDEAGDDCGDRVHSQTAAAVGGRDEDDAGDVLATGKEDQFADGRHGWGTELEVIEAAFEELVPEFLASFPDEEARDEAAHAVSDEDDVVRGAAAITFQNRMKPVEFAAQDGGGFPHREARGVEEEPELVAFSDFRVGHEFIGGAGPRFGSGEQTMNEDDGDAVGVVGLELEKSCAVEFAAWKQEGSEVERSVARARDEECERGGEVGGQFDRMARHRGLARLEHIVKDQRRATIRKCDRGRRGQGEAHWWDPGLALEKR